MASTASFSDNFDSNSLSVNWDTSLSADATQVFNRHNQIEITHTAAIQYNTLQTTASYDLTGSFVHVLVTNIGNQALASHECILQIRLDANNLLWFTISGNNISAFKKVAAGANTQVGSSVAYNAHEHKWLRFRESGGTIFWDTSYDGINWTNLWSLATPFVITAIKPNLQTGCFANEASSSGANFDSYNVVQVAGAEMGNVYRHIEVGDGMSRNEGAT